jgi:hypothetical protein
MWDLPRTDEFARIEKLDFGHFHLGAFQGGWRRLGLGRGWRRRLDR